MSRTSSEPTWWVIAAATGPRIRKAGQDDGQAVEPEGEDQDVLTDDPDRLREPGGWPRASGSSGSPIRTIEPASAAISAPDATEGQADVGRRQSRGVVDPVADHGDDPPLDLPGRDPVGLADRRQAGLDLLDMNLLRHRPRGRLAVAGQDRQVLEAEMFQVVDDVVRLEADPVASPDRPDDSRPLRDEQGRLPRVVQPLQGGLDLGRDLQAVLPDQA